MSSFHKLTDDELVSLYTEGCDEAFDVIQIGRASCRERVYVLV